MDINDFNVTDEAQWVPLSKGVRLKIARMNNEPYREYIKKKAKPYRSAIRAGQVDEDVMQEIVIGALARHVLLDWEGLQDGDKPFPYSVENAERLLADKESFRDLVTSLASDNDLFKEADTEDGEKNS